MWIGIEDWNRLILNIEEMNAHLIDTKKREDAIEQSQGTLLAALNEIEKRQDQDREAISSWISRAQISLSGKLNSIRTELAASIGNAFLNFEAKVKKAATDKPPREAKRKGKK